MADPSATTTALELRIAPTARAPADVRRSLLALREGVEPEVFSNLQLLLNELVTNSVRHGGLGEDQRIAVRIAATPATVRALVTDPGGRFQPARQGPEPGEASGWGLLLVDRIADRWGVTADGHTEVWFELDRPSPNHRESD